jgi:isoleucyl-tRNA synthetase
MPYPKPAARPDDANSSAPSDVTPSPVFPEIETEVLAFWKRDGTFRASIENREGAPEWVFYDGPPFAKGQPHNGHQLTG